MADEELQDEHWTVRRQKAALCKIHNLHYDPRLTSSCILCRKEEDPTPPPKPQFLNLLVVLLGLALVLAKLISGFVSSAPAPQPVVEAPVVEVRQLDPENYRNALEAIDTACFASTATDLWVMGKELRAALATLEGELRESPHEVGRTTAGEVDSLARTVPEAPDFDTLERAREAWPELRDKRFKPASWFRYPTSRHDRDPAVLVAYQDVAVSLAGLLEEAALRAGELSQPTVVGFDDPDDRARREQSWRRFSSTFRQRLDDLRGQTPPRPDASAGTDFLLAIQGLEQAFAQVSSAAGSDLNAAPALLDGARDTVAEAQRAFDSLVY